jgi:hypothetical protein
VNEPRIVVSLVEKFEDGGQDFWLFFRESDPFALRLEDLATAAGSKVRGDAEDFLVGSEETLIRTDAEGDDGRSQIAGRC